MDAEICTLDGHRGLHQGEKAVRLPVHGCNLPLEPTRLILKRVYWKRDRACWADDLGRIVAADTLDKRIHVELASGL